MNCIVLYCYLMIYCFGSRSSSSIYICRYTLIIFINYISRHFILILYSINVVVFLFKKLLILLFVELKRVALFVVFLFNNEELLLLCLLAFLLFAL